jgi:hypothetical protein
MVNFPEAASFAALTQLYQAPLPWEGSENFRGLVASSLVQGFHSGQVLSSFTWLYTTATGASITPERSTTALEGNNRDSRNISTAKQNILMISNLRKRMNEVT